MKTILAAAVLALGFAVAGSGAHAAPLSPAPAASIDVSDGKIATENVTWRRHHHHRRHWRPYYGYSFGFVRPWRDCWWRYGRRVCVWR